MLLRAGLTALAIITIQASADTLGDLDIYKRCFVRMVRAVPDSVNDPLYKMVQAGSLKGPAACLKLFDTAAFDPTGVLAARSNEQSRRIVKTFNDFHRTFFSSRKPTQATSQDLGIYDIEEPALYFTRALFQGKSGNAATKFSDVVTLSTGLTGVRDRSNLSSVNNFGALTVLTPAGANMLLQYNQYEKKSNGVLAATAIGLSVPDASIVQTGELVGVKAPAALVLPNYLITRDSSVEPYVDQAIGAFQAQAHFGGGVLGSQGFLNANFNLNLSQIPNGVDAINRRTSSRIYSDILCEQEPTLTAADVTAEVVHDSTYTFQQSESCMQCHSSNDNTGYVFNHLVLFRSGPQSSSLGALFFGVGALPEVSNAGAAFALRPTSSLGAYMHYRENLSSGGAIKDPISSIADMGMKISARNDLYLCAAKRYYKFFTGVDVDLNDTATAGSVDALHQNFVIKLGQRLKSTQSLRTLFNDIFNSAQFSTRDYKISGAQ